MTRVKPNAMMFANVSGCAQTAVVRRERPKAKPAKKASGKSAGRVKKTRAKKVKRNAKRS